MIRRLAGEADPVADAQQAAELKRFRQAVRSSVRSYLKREREAPPLTLWASEGANPRRVARVPVGAADTRFQVMSNITGALRDRGSTFAALGRLLHMGPAPGGEHVPSAVFGLVVVSTEAVEMWEADAVAGRLGSWRESVFSNAEDERASVDQWFFLMQALRTNARRARDAA